MIMAFFLGPLKSLSLYFTSVTRVSLACMFLYACKYYILFITVSYSHPYHSLVEASLLLRSSRLHFVFDLQHPHVYQLTSMHYILYTDQISYLILIFPQRSWMKNTTYLEVNLYLRMLHPLTTTGLAPILILMILNVRITLGIRNMQVSISDK